MSSWTINTKTFASLGLVNLKRHRQSQVTDVVTFMDVKAAFDSAPQFTANSTIIIKRDGVQWFYGRVTRINITGSARQEFHEYELQGPWWYLDNLVMQQDWNLFTGGYPVGAQLSDNIIGISESGSYQTADQIIAEILDYVISAGAPIQYVAPAIPADWPHIPAEEVRDVTCAELIRRILRWVPDAVTWFDYSTTPPTFHFERRPSLTAVSLSTIPTATQKLVTALQVNPRYDLQVPAVFLKLLNAQDISGGQVEWGALNITIDQYPLAAVEPMFGALVATMDFPSRLTERIVTEELAANYHLDATWWKAHDPSLDDADITLSIISGSTSSELDYELIEGRLHQWMNISGVDISAEECTVEALALITVTKSGTVIRTEERKLSCKIIATDAPSGTYSTVPLTGGPGASPYAGMAQILYTALNPLHYEGEISLVETECFSLSSLSRFQSQVGAVLNLTAGRAEWAAMSALIQQIEENLDAGETTITFGPPEHLGPQDLVQLLRANRNRMAIEHGSTRDTGIMEVSDGKTPQQDAAATPGMTRKLVIATSDMVHKITLDPSQLAGGAYKFLQVNPSETDLTLDYGHMVDL